MRKLDDLSRYYCFLIILFIFIIIISIAYLLIVLKAMVTLLLKQFLAVQDCRKKNLNNSLLCEPGWP